MKQAADIEQTINFRNAFPDEKKAAVLMKHRKKLMKFFKKVMKERLEIEAQTRRAELLLFTSPVLAWKRAEKLADFAIVGVFCIMSILMILLEHVVIHLTAPAFLIPSILAVILIASQYFCSWWLMHNREDAEYDDNLDMIRSWLVRRWRNALFDRSSFSSQDEALLCLNKRDLEKFMEIELEEADLKTLKSNSLIEVNPEFYPAGIRGALQLIAYY